MLFNYFKKRSYESLLVQSSEARCGSWSRLGKVDEQVLSFLINPTLKGGPTWPSQHQAYRRIVRSDSVILCSEGLSDPFEDQLGEGQGFGLEFYLETDDPKLRGDISNVKGTWQFDLIYQISNFAATHRQFRYLLDDMKLISTELYDVRVPDHMRNDFGRVGVLIGQQTPNIPEMIELPLGNIRFVSVKLLTLQELAFVTEFQAEARHKLDELFKQSRSHHISSLDRASAV